jgi:hypothetical protein
MNILFATPCEQRTGSVTQVAASLAESLEARGNGACLVAFGGKAVLHPLAAHAASATSLDPIAKPGGLGSGRTCLPRLRTAGDLGDFRRVC